MNIYLVYTALGFYLVSTLLYALSLALNRPFSGKTGILRHFNGLADPFRECPDAVFRSRLHSDNQYLRIPVISFPVHRRFFYLYPADIPGSI